MAADSGAALTEFDGHFELSLPTASLSAPAHQTNWSPFQNVPPKPEGEADDADSDDGDEVLSCPAHCASYHATADGAHHRAAGSAHLVCCADRASEV